MKSSLISIGVFSALLASSLPAAADFDTARAALRPINQSNIRARIAFVDTGNPTGGLLFIGAATGLDPSATYVSLIYDTGSVARGPNACLPTDASLSFTQMVLGVWQVAPNGTGTLIGRTTGAAYADLDAVGTVSVRLDTAPGTPLPSAPDPVRFVLKACGGVN